MSALTTPPKRPQRPPRSTRSPRSHLLALLNARRYDSQRTADRHPKYEVALRAAGRAKAFELAGELVRVFWEDGRKGRNGKRKGRENMPATEGMSILELDDRIDHENHWQRFLSDVEVGEYHYDHIIDMMNRLRERLQGAEKSGKTG